MSDTTKPVLLGLILPDIDLAAGTANFTIGVQAQDEPGGSGVRWVSVYFKKPLWLHYGGLPGPNSMFRFDDWFDTDNFHDATPTSASQTVVLSNLTQSGIYEIALVSVVDASGKESMYDTAALQALGLRTSMTVTNGVQDAVAPTLVDLKLPANIDLNAGIAQGIRMEGSARDTGGAGVDKLTITFDKPLHLFQSASFGPSIEVNLWHGMRMADAVESLYRELGGRPAPGVYNITNVRVSDYLDNVRDYSAPQLQAMGIGTTMTVTGNPAPNPTPTPMANVAWTMAEQGLVLTVTPDDWSSALTPDKSFVLTLARHPGAKGPVGVSLTGGATGELAVHDNGDTLLIIGNKLTGVGPGTGIAVTMSPVAAGVTTVKHSEFVLNSAHAGQTGAPPAVDYYRGTDAADRIDRAVLPDLADGGGGLDILRVHGSRGDYRIVKSGDGFVLDRPHDTDARLVNIERIAFDDGQVALDTGGAPGQLYRLYQAAFDRAPDLGGIGHWLRQMEAGDSLKQIAGYFVASKEFIDLTAAAASDRDFVTALYDNVLHRQPDAVGLEFWVSVLGRGALNRAELLVEFSESPENVAQLVAAIENGIDFL